MRLHSELNAILSNCPSVSPEWPVPRTTLPTSYIWEHKYLSKNHFLAPTACTGQMIISDLSANHMCGDTENQPTASRQVDISALTVKSQFQSLNISDLDIFCPLEDINIWDWTPSLPMSSGDCLTTRCPVSWRLRLPGQVSLCTMQCTDWGLTEDWLHYIIPE